MSRGDVARNYLTTEDDQLPEEPEYDKFAYENDKKMWGLDNSFNENDGIDGLRGEARKERRLHYTSGTVSLTRISPLDGDVVFRFPEFLKEHLDGNWIIKFLRKLKGSYQWCIGVQW